MKVYPDTFEALMNFFKKLPGIGEKSAERMAFSTLNLTLEEIEDASDILVRSKKNLRPCSVCGLLTDQDTCSVCSSTIREKNLICVVEDDKSAFAFEKAGNYKGTYHILKGLISPMDYIGAEDIQLSSLVRRVESLDNPEIILALKSSIEGETTMLYIKKIFEDKKVTISRLSYGLPSGAEIDYLDMLTLDKALEDRKKISE